MNFDQFQALGSADYLHRLNAEAPKWVALALVIVIGWQLSTIVWSLIPGGSSPASGVPRDGGDAALGTGRKSVPGVDISAITNSHLFGVTDARASAPEPEQTVVAETNLNLKLKGTIAADDPRYALAIIADNANREKVYAVRDTVASGTTLHAVEKEQVILNRSGRLEALRLPREFESSPRSVSRSTAARISDNTVNPPGASGSIRDVITQNVTSLTDVIRPQPYFSGGQQKGYRVYPGKDRKQFADLGLRPGDLVIDINGTPMTDPRQGMEVFRSLGDATSVTVTVERNGQPETLTLSTSQLNSDN